MSTRITKIVLMLAIAGQFLSLHAKADLIGNISVGTKANNFNLSTMNGDVSAVNDWVVWGQGTSTSLSPTNSMLGGSAISDLTLYNPTSQPLRGLGQFDLGEYFQWTNGTPTTSASNVQTGLQVDPFQPTNFNALLGTGFSFQVAGSPTETRRLYAWVGQHSGTSTFTATLNGNTPVSYQLTASQDSSEYALLSFDFKPSSVSDLLTVSGTVSGVTVGGNGTAYTNNYWFGAAVGTVNSTPVPEIDPAGMGSVLAFVSGALGLLERRRLKTA